MSGKKVIGYSMILIPFVAIVGLIQWACILAGQWWALLAFIGACLIIVIWIGIAQEFIDE